MTNTYNNYGFGSDYCYYIKPNKKGDKDHQADLAVGAIGSNYSSMNNCEQTIGIKVDATHSGTFTELSDSEDAIATISGTGFKFSDYDSCDDDEDAVLSLSEDYERIVVGGGYRAHVVLSCTSVAPGYKFIGWFDEDGNELESNDYYPNAAANVYAHFVKYETATIGATGWTTFSSTVPLDLSNLGTATAYYASSAAAAGVTLTPTTTTALAATKGIMLKGTPSAKVYIPIATAAGSDISGNLLVGCPNGATVKHDDNNGYNYVFVNNSGTGEFQHIVSGANGIVEIPAGKAYLSLASAPTGAPDRFRIIEAGNDATDIQSIEANEVAVKFIENGQLLIRKDGVVYDMTGRVIR